MNGKGCVSLVDLVAGCRKQSQHAGSVGPFASCGNHNRIHVNVAFTEVQIGMEQGVK